MGKIFRLNVTVSYFEGTNINRYRKPILDIFKSFAWLYHLDYAISINHDFGLESGELIWCIFARQTRPRYPKRS